MQQALESIPDGRPQRVPDGRRSSRRCRRAATRTGTACRIRRQLRRSRWAAAPVRSNNFLVDGFPVTDLQNRASTNPSMEAVQEMKVQVHTYDAEMGRTGGGVMNMAARSGANAVRRARPTRCIRPTSCGEQLLIPKLLEPAERAASSGATAAAAAAARSSRTRPSSGSPARSTSTTSRSRTRSCVPTDAEQRGDFSRLTRNGAVCQDRSTDPLDRRRPFPGNIIPANRISPVGQKLASYIPTPDSQVDNGNVELQHDRPAAEHAPTSSRPRSITTSTTRSR